MDHLVISKECIGRGAFGFVYKANLNGREVAVKKCQIAQQGVSCLVECVMLSTLRHKHLNSCLDIVCTKSDVFMVQNIALGDLSEYRRKRVAIGPERFTGSKGHKSPVGASGDTAYPRQIRSWYYQITLALDYLHANCYIHADIKASNILFYEDTTVKLTDFSLSVKMLYTEQKFFHEVCTYTHRPPEVYCKEGWDKSLDIWCLGCTFYQIENGTLLFPKQPKQTLRQSSALCLFAWLKTKHTFEKSGKVWTLPQQFNSNIEYNKSTDNHLFANINDKELRVLLGQMITEQSERLTTKQLIASNFFNNVRDGVGSFAGSTSLPETTRSWRREIDSVCVGASLPAKLSGPIGDFVARGRGGSLEASLRVDLKGTIGEEVGSFTSPTSCISLSGNAPQSLRTAEESPRAFTLLSIPEGYDLEGSSLLRTPSEFPRAFTLLTSASACRRDFISLDVEIRDSILDSIIELCPCTCCTVLDGKALIGPERHTDSLKSLSVSPRHLKGLLKSYALCNSEGAVKKPPGSPQLPAAVKALTETESLWELPRALNNCSAAAENLGVLTPHLPTCDLGYISELSIFIYYKIWKSLSSETIREVAPDAYHMSEKEKQTLCIYISSKYVRSRGICRKILDNLSIQTSDPHSRTNFLVAETEIYNLLGFKFFS